MVSSQSIAFQNLFKQVDTLNTKYISRKNTNSIKNIPDKLLIEELFGGDKNKIYYNEELVDYDTQIKRTAKSKKTFEAVCKIKLGTAFLFVINCNDELFLYSFLNQKKVDSLQISQRLGDTETYHFKASKIKNDKIFIFDYGLVGIKPGFIEKKTFILNNGKFKLESSQKQSTLFWPVDFIEGKKKVISIDPFYKY